MTTQTLCASPATDADFLRDLLSRAMNAGASDAQVNSSASRARKVELRDGMVQRVEQAESANITLTTYIGKRRASLGTNKFDRATMNQFVDRVIGMTRLATEDSYCGLAPVDLLIEPGDDRFLDLYDPAEPDAAALTEMAGAVEMAARGVSGVSETQNASAGWSRDEARVVSSGGLDRKSERSSFYADVSVVAGSADRREVAGASRSARWQSDLPSPESIGAEAGKEAARKVGARKIPSRKAAVILDRRTSMSLLRPFIGAIAGEAVARRTSFLLDKLGRSIFSPGFTVTDNAFVLRGLGSRACDAEGVVPTPRSLVDSGVLTAWLVNCAVSRELGIPSTGHAGGPSNLTVLPGEKSQQELMSEAREGLLVTELMGASLNPHTGDWSVGASGQWFEGGEIAFPVSEITIAGCLPELYKELVRGSDLEIRGAANAPSLLIPQMTIGGS